MGHLVGFPVTFGGFKVDGEGEDSEYAYCWSECRNPFPDHPGSYGDLYPGVLRKSVGSTQKFSRFRVRADFLDGSAICNRMNVQYVRAGTNPEWSILSLHAGFLLSGIKSEVWLGSTIPPLQLLQFF